MKNRTNTSLSIFISDIRKSSKEDFMKKILIEKRNLYNTKNISYNKILTMIYFILQDINIDVMDLVKACVSEDLNIKKTAYLGLTLINSNNLLILTVNTLMNDLKSLETRELAINFLCNMNIKDKIYTDLGEYICISSNMDKNIAKSIIAKDKLCNLKKIGVVGNNDSLVFVKLQLILDKINFSKEFSLSENDTLFLISIYPTVKCGYLKTKLVQLYKKLYELKELKVKPNFYIELENDVISPSESIKPTIIIALSIEITELFLLTRQSTTKSDHFLFRLIDSNNPNSRFIGFKLAKKYGTLSDKLIDRSIKLGLNISYCRDTLLELINKNNYKEIYKRKEEIRFIMDKNDTGYIKSKDILFELLLKLIKYGNDEFIKKVYFDFPELSFVKELSNNISESSKIELFTKLITKQTLEYYHLIYSILPTNMKNKEFYEEIFCTHLESIITKKYYKQDQLLDKLIFTFCKLKNLTFFRDFIKDKYKELYNMQSSSELLKKLLNGIYLMNTKSKDKVLNIADDKFLIYQKNEKFLQINFDQNCSIYEITDEKNQVLNYESDKSEIKIHDHLNLKKLIVKISYFNNIIIKMIYLN